MEIIAELILGFIFEVLIGIGDAVLFDSLLHSLGAAFETRDRRNPVFAGIGYFLIGLLLGGLSVIIFPESFVRSERFHGINLIITPVLCGLVMAAIGRWLDRHGKTLLRLDSFVYGFVFAFGLALVRFLFTS